MVAGRSNRLLFRWLFVLFAAGLATMWFVFLRQPPSLDAVVQEARTALAHRDYARAEALAASAMKDSPESITLMLIAARAAQGSGHLERSAEYLGGMSDGNSHEHAQGHQLAAAIHLELGNASHAEHHLRRLLALRPESDFAARALGRLLMVEGRGWEAQPVLLGLVRRREHDLEELLMLGLTDENFDAGDEVTRLLSANPSDPVPQISRARKAFQIGEWDTAERLLRDILQSRPDCVEAAIWYGWTLLRTENHVAFTRWISSIPEYTREHPLFWVIRAEQCSAAGDLPSEIRCYVEAVRRNPSLTMANHRLGQLLANVDPRAAEAFRDRALKLRDVYTQQMELWMIREKPEMLSSAQGVRLLRSVAALNDQLGRPVESAAWYAFLAADSGVYNLDVSQVSTLVDRARNTESRHDDSALLAAKVDTSDFPLAPVSSKPRMSANSVTSSDVAKVVFADVADSRGMKFTYFNNHNYDVPDSEKTGMPIHEETGGGVAAFDLDGDAWPDVYFTQGCKWPPNPTDFKHLDQLYRNVRGDRFVDVTSQSSIVENGFSQGVSAGDLDNDGFCDLYVANIGTNRLFQNNGDGTFSEVIAATMSSRHDFTSSCLLTDVNGDGYPDLYDVNYVADEDIDHLCDTDGLLRGCPPRSYTAAVDRLWLSDGQGAFVDATEMSGLAQQAGLGLGIVAGDLDDSGVISLYVANDTDPNCWLVNSAPPGQIPVFQNLAYQAGIALSGEGESQGSMGVAVADANGDGSLDLFVTNYFGEQNTLYQRSAAVFTDQSLQSGLWKGGMSYVGFGTQFVDADLDGWSDLVVANGHTDDFTHRGNTPFRMAPQFFYNTGAGHFIELPASALGDYGSGEFLGRGLIRLDWNRDGREEVVVSNIQQPATLLENRTPGVGRFLCVRLIGVDADRDSVGATVQVACNDRILKAQLTSGDGYMASNQRQLVFGLGLMPQTGVVSIRWPASNSRSDHAIVPDSEMVFVEGRTAGYSIPR